MWRDLLQSLRIMRKNPGFAITAVLTVALGIGGNTAMFTVVRAVLLKPLDYRDPDRLVRIEVGTPTRYNEMRPVVRSFSDLAAFAGRAEDMTLTGGPEPEALLGARVAGNFLRVLGVEPLLGRSFLPDEDSSGGAPVAIISAELWRRRFGGDPQVCGKTATFDATVYTIVGVLPTDFQFPFPGAAVWVPRPAEPTAIPPQSRANSPVLSAIARLKPGVTIEQAAAELLVLSEQYSKAHPAMLDAGPRKAMRPVLLKDRLVADVRSMLWMLFGAVGFVLLIACANVASLLLARAETRSREFAVRAALGAGRGRIVRQLLAENLALALLGGGLGVLLAQWGLRAIQGMSAFNMPRSGEIRIDGVVLGFTVALAITTGVLFGLAPSLRASRPDLADALRASGERTGGLSPRRGALGLSTRGVLVMGQVALSVVLLIGAVLLMESLARLQSVDSGFQPAGLLTMKIALPPARYDTGLKRATFCESLIRRLESTPGVRAAGITMALPMTGWAETPVQRADQPLVKLNERPITVVQIVTAGYFRTMGIPLRRGREFNDRDLPTAPAVAIVSETFVHQFWPDYPAGPDPIGQRVLTGARMRVAEIVGIVADVHQSGLDSDPRLELYSPSSQGAPNSVMLAIRPDGDPLRFATTARGEISELDRDLPVSAVRTMDDIVEASEGQRRLILTLLAAFAGVALVLALIGLYGVIAYSVAQRTQELGIRRALGAQPSDILRLVLGQGVGLALAGVAIGVVGALALTRVMKDLLFHVSATDPATYGGISVLFLAVALAACYLPARRALRVDPMALWRGI
jgi:putative ABC transport system permease protein